MYQYVHDDDENTFQIVDSSRVPKPAFQKRSRYQQNVNQNGLSMIEANFCRYLAFQFPTKSKSFFDNANRIHRNAEEIENHEEFGNVS